MKKLLFLILFVLTLCSCSCSNFKRNTMQPVDYVKAVAKCEIFDNYVYTIDDVHNKRDCYLITFYIEQQNYIEIRKFIVWFDDNYVDYCDWIEVE